MSCLLKVVSVHLGHNTFHLHHDTTVFLFRPSCHLQAQLCSLVVCVCVVNLMIASEAPSQHAPLWAISPSWSHSNAWDYRQGSDLTRRWWRAACCLAAGTTECREVYFFPGTLTVENLSTLFFIPQWGSYVVQRKSCGHWDSWCLGSTVKKKNKTRV